MRWSALACVAGLTSMLASSSPGEPFGAIPSHGRLADIRANDNRTPAGRLREGVLTVDLTAAAGLWYPERDHAPGREAYVFGESEHALQNPGPLLRVPAGTEIRATIHNRIDGNELVVHGLHERPGAPDTIHVQPGGTRVVRFRVDAPGTYYYWATVRGARNLVGRFGKESQLHGALIVDPSAGSPPDRIFVIGIDDDSADIPANRPLQAAVVNGHSWPHSEIATTHVGDTVRLRWINPSDRRHPMHLHGFYFQVESRGDGIRDTLYTPAEKRLVVTELMQQGGTFTMVWVPDRAGNWLMHCHMAEHIAPELRKGRVASGEPSHAANHALDVMSGLVTGWTVLPRSGVTGNTRSAPVRNLRFVVQPVPERHGEMPGIGVAIEDEAAARTVATAPGPPLVLVRGESVRIRVVNRLTEPTSIHWHGMELESYYDGVPGWSGEPGRTAPHIEPQDSFDVFFTPPRAGTFIYHSHFEEKRQLASGLFGPLIVTEPGETYDPETDRTWILSNGGLSLAAPILLNGSVRPDIELDAGRSHRVRLINISPSVPLSFALLADDTPVSWRPLAKDGAALPGSQAQPQPAVLLVGVGEVYDFELVPADTLRVRVLDPGNAVRLSVPIRVRRRRAAGVPAMRRPRRRRLPSTADALRRTGRTPFVRAG